MVWMPGLKFLSTPFPSNKNPLSARRMVHNENNRIQRWLRFHITCSFPVFIMYGRMMNTLYQQEEFLSTHFFEAIGFI